MSQIKEMKMLARQYLGQKGNWTRMIFAGGLLIFACFLPVLLSANITAIILGDTEETAALWGREDLLTAGIAALFFLLITVPSAALFYRYCYRLYAAGRDGFGAVTAKTRVSPMRIWREGFGFLLRPVGVGLLFVGAYWLASLSEFLLYLPLVAVAIGLSILLMWGTGGCFLLPYFCCRGEVKRAWKQSRRAMRHRYKAYGAYILSFLGWVVLSLLTAGVLLIFYVLPLMMFTYFALGDRMTAELLQEEKDQ